MKNYEYLNKLLVNKEDESNKSTDNMASILILLVDCTKLELCDFCVLDNKTCHTDTCRNGIKKWLLSEMTEKDLLNINELKHNLKIIDKEDYVYLKDVCNIFCDD